VSILRDRWGSVQQPLGANRFTHQPTQAVPAERIRQLATALTPNHCYVLIEAGAPRWCDLPIPWSPLTELNTRIAQELLRPEWGLLMRAPHSEFGLQLTPLGEQVVAYGLSTVLPGLGVFRG